jgi:hypothetical protein
VSCTCEQCIVAADGSKATEDAVSGELLLVGSIPLDTPQEVFATFGAPLGKYRCVPLKDH